MCTNAYWQTLKKQQICTTSKVDAQDNKLKVINQDGVDHIEVTYLREKAM